jgi:transcriptional regulator with XRE-family HTH domain
MDYAKAIRISRALADMPQRELASRIGVDASMISMLESGLRKPSLQTLEKIADALELPFHLFTLLGAARKDARAARAQEIEQLAVSLARLLLNGIEAEDDSDRSRKRNRKTEHRERKSSGVHPRSRSKKAS